MKTNCFKIIASASLVGSHAVIADHDDPATKNTGRNLRGFMADFQMHDEMSCLSINGEKGSKLADGEVDLYDDISRKRCKKTCLSLNSRDDLFNMDTCYGFGYSSSGECEIWKVPIRRSELKDAPGFKCYIKDETLIPHGDHFRKFNGNGCRASDGDKGSTSTGEFDLFKKVSKDTCENKCVELGKPCYGYEYTSQGGKCEVWKVRIDEEQLKFMPGQGLDCYIKNGSNYEGPSTSTDEGNQFNLDARKLTGFTDSNNHIWKSSGKLWYEHSLLHSDRKWKVSLSHETDENSVYLFENGGTAQIDLKLAQITYCPNVGRCYTMADIKTVAASQDQQQCSQENKEVRIYKFSINGKWNIFSDTPRAEHQLTIDGDKYFPTRGSDCDEYRSDGYCVWKENKAHYIGDIAPWKSISAVSITVGTKEHDDFGPDDIMSAKLKTKDWYIDTCETYRVVVAADFYQGTTNNCFDLSSTLKDEAHANLQDCDNWTEPADSFVWYLEVKPAGNKRRYRVFSETP